jgi:hypothetical protein
VNARRLAVPAVASSAAVVLLAGAAVASYRTSVATTGTGPAAVQQAKTLTLDVTGTVSSNLYPGGPGATVSFSVTNPYTRAVSLTGIVATGNVVVSPLPGKTCATTGITVATPTGLPIELEKLDPANGLDGVTSVTLANVVKMGTSADNGCQGATFTIPFQVTGQL